MFRSVHSPTTEKKNYYWILLLGLTNFVVSAVWPIWPPAFFRYMSHMTNFECPNLSFCYWPSTTHFPDLNKAEDHIGRNIVTADEEDKDKIIKDIIKRLYFIWFKDISTENGIGEASSNPGSVYSVQNLFLQMPFWGWKAWMCLFSSYL